MHRLALTVLNVFLVTFCEIRVWKHVRDGEEDYRVRMLKRQLEQQKQLQEDLLAGIVRAKALADERAAHRAAVHSSSKDITEGDFDNPIVESDDEESADSSKKGKKKG